VNNVLRAGFVFTIHLSSIWRLFWHIGTQFKSRGLVCIVRPGKMGVDSCGFQWVSSTIFAMLQRPFNRQQWVSGWRVGSGSGSGRAKAIARQTRDSGSVIAKATRHGHSFSAGALRFLIH
jgi:hypothetical protein